MGKIKNAFLSTVLVASLGACYDTKLPSGPSDVPTRREFVGSFEESVSGSSVQVDATVHYDQSWKMRTDELQGLVQKGLEQGGRLLDHQLPQYVGEPAPPIFYTKLGVDVYVEGELTGIDFSTRLSGLAFPGPEKMQIICSDHEPSAIENCVSHQLQHAMSAQLQSSLWSRALHRVTDAVYTPQDTTPPVFLPVYNIHGEQIVDDFLFANAKYDKTCDTFISFYSER